MLWEYYPTYLHYFYKKHPEALDLPFQEHRQCLFDDHFGWPSDLAQYMNLQGIKTEFVVANDKTLQIKWAKEINFSNFNWMNWKKAIVFEQIRRFEPDVLFKTNPKDDFDNDLDTIKGYYKKVLFYLGHKIPKEELLIRADFILTPFPERILKYYPYLKNIVSFHSGFNPAILNKIGDIRKKYDIVFVGNITPEHRRRAEILAYLIENGIDIKIFGTVSGLGAKYAIKKGLIKLKGDWKTWKIKPFAKPFLSSDFKRNAKIVKEVIQPPVFGIDYYRALAQARIGLNIHIDLSNQEFAGNMRMFEITGVGTCLLTDAMKTNYELFEEGIEILAFKSKEHLLNLLKGTNFESKAIHNIARSGQKRTMKDYCIKRMFEDLKVLI